MKKFLSLLLTLAVLCTAFIQVFSVSASTETSDSGVWDGSTDATFTESETEDGTAEKPYLIDNGAELYAAVKNKNAGTYFKITKDIYLNNVSADKWYEGEKLNSWFGKDTTNVDGFEDSIDGDGYTVYGLYYSGTKINAGLIPTAAGNAEIKNINIRKAFIKNSKTGTTTFTAAILGQAKSGEGKITISGCSGDETVLINGANGSSNKAIASGIVAYASGSGRTLEIKDCYFITASGNITVTGSSNSETAGLLGNAWGSTEIKISTSYTANIKPISSYGSVTTFSVNNVYTNVTGASHVSVLSDDSMKDTAAAENMAGFDFTDTWTTVDNEYPKLRIDKSIVIDTPEDDNIWHGETAEGYSEGEGTEAKPYIIKTGAELYKAIAADKGLKDNVAAYYKLANDIYLNDVTDDEWYLGENLNSWFGNTTAAANGFAGYFDGDGYTIYGIYFKDTSKECAGLFPTVNDGAVIKNINLRKAYICNNNISSATYTGGILGLKPGGTSATVSGCSGDETVFVSGILTSSKNTTAGGLVGAASSGTLTIKDSYFIAGADTVTAKTNKAGLIGDSWGTLVVNNCYTANIAPLKKFGSTTTATHIYTNVEDAERANYVADENMKGAAAVTNMANLGYEVFYANDGYPLFRVNGKRIWDVNGDGIGANADDVTSMRKYLLGDSQEVLSCRLSINSDTAVDICDLVSLASVVYAE